MKWIKMNGRDVLLDLVSLDKSPLPRSDNMGEISLSQNLIGKLVKCTMYCFIFTILFNILEVIFRLVNLVTNLEPIPTDVWTGVAVKIGDWKLQLPFQ